MNTGNCILTFINIYNIILFFFKKNCVRFAKDIFRSITDFFLTLATNGRTTHRKGCCDTELSYLRLRKLVVKKLYESLVSRGYTLMRITKLMKS